MNKAVIYARFSSHNQREESIDGQLRECKKYADREGLVVVGEYIDRAISGKTDDRADFQRMIRDSEKHGWDFVIVYAIDRFARNRYDSAIYKAKLKKNGVRVVYAKQTIPDGPEGIILESVMEGYAEYYSENLSLHIKRGLHENALQCKKTAGSIPYGYDVDDELHFVINPAEAQVVRELYALYLLKGSFTAILNHCNEKGYRNKKGKPFTKHGIYAIFHNVKYKGVYKYDDVEIENGVPEIIPKDVWDAVQDKMRKSPMSHAHTSAPADFLLTGKLFCGECGKMMIGESGRSKNGSIHYYYKCVGRKRERNCTKATEQKEWIEKAVIDFALSMLSDEAISLISERAFELLQKENEENDILPALKEQLKGITKRIANVIDLIEIGGATESAKQRLIALEDEKADLTTRISDIEEIQRQPLLTKERIEFYLLSVRDGKLFDHDYNRRLVDTFVRKVTVFDEDHDGGKGRRLEIELNLSGDNNVGKSSTVVLSTPLDPTQSNTVLDLSNMVLRTVLKKTAP